MVNYIPEFKKYQTEFETAFSRLVALNLSGKVESEQLETVIKAVLNKYSNIQCQKAPNEHSYYDLIINGDKVSVKSGKQSAYQIDNATDIYNDILDPYNLSCDIFSKPYFSSLAQKSIIFFKKDVGHYKIIQFDLPKLYSMIDSIEYVQKQKLYELDFLSAGKCLMCLKCSNGIQFKGQQSNAFQRGLWFSEKYAAIYPVIDFIDLKLNLKGCQTFEQFLTN